MAKKLNLRYVTGMWFLRIRINKILEYFSISEVYHYELHVFHVFGNHVLSAYFPTAHTQTAPYSFLFYVLTWQHWNKISNSQIFTTSNLKLHLKDGYDRLMAAALVVRIWKVIFSPIFHVHIYMENAINILWRWWLVCTAPLLRPHKMDLHHIPAAFSPPTCAIKRPRACVAAPHSQKPLRVFIIFTFFMKKGMSCSTPDWKNHQFGGRSSSDYLFSSQTAVFCHKLIFQSTPYVLFLNLTCWI